MWVPGVGQEVVVTFRAVSHMGWCTYKYVYACEYWVAEDAHSCEREHACEHVKVHG